MSVRQNHIIGRQSLEIGFDGGIETFGMQDRIAEVYYEMLLPRMEALFDELYRDDQVVCIDRIEIDCGMIATDHWEEQWVDIALRQLAAQLWQADKRVTSITDSTADFFYYLRLGRLPWNTRIQSLSQLQELLRMEQPFPYVLLELIHRNPAAAVRLARSFPERFTREVIDRVLELPAIDKNEWRHLLEEAGEVGSGSFSVLEKLLIQLSARVINKVAGSDQVSKELNEVAGGNDESTEPWQPGSSTAEPGKDAIYINNAGLVIFHPFLAGLFEQLNFWKEEKWCDSSSLLQAAISVQHLATGLQFIEEFEMVLPRILCGMQPDEGTIGRMEVDDEIRSACDVVTVSLIEHWKALKNTGPESFRNTFVHRKGKLTKVDNGWLLQVESQAVDVLMGSLPWGIGVIRLPWMKELVFTEWV